MAYNVYVLYTTELTLKTYKHIVLKYRIDASVFSTTVGLEHLFYRLFDDKPSYKPMLIH